MLDGCPVSARPFPDCNICESFQVALPLVDMSKDYQRQLLLDIVVAVHLFRDGLADLLERSPHEGNHFWTVGAATFN
jgi:hypothetical protein